MRSFLSQPYPLNDNTARKLAVCGAIGLFVALFLGVFKPFGMDTLPTATQWLHAALFGAVTAAVSSLLQIGLPKLLPQVFTEQNWRSWKEIVFLLLTTAAIGAANYAVMLWLYPENASLVRFWNVQLITLQLGVFPVVGVVFMKQLQLYRRYNVAARETNAELHHPPIAPSATEPIPALSKEAAAPAYQAPNLSGSTLTLHGDNQSETLTLAPDDLLFIASADNYVNVRYRQGGQLRSQLLRGTLKKMEDQLAAHSAFFRCHRMYLVNLNRVTAVSGNAQGLKLHLAGLDEPVPVSRSLTDTVKERLHGVSRSPQTA